MKINKNDFIEFLCSPFLLIGLWIVIFLSVFIFAFTSHASEPYFPMLQNNNSKFTDAVKNKIDTTFDSENNYIFCKWDSFAYNRNYMYVLYFPKNSGNMIYGEIGSNGYDFSLYYSSGTFPSNNIRKIEVPDNGAYINQYTGFNLSVFSGSSNLYSSTTDYVSNFRMYTNNTNEVVFMKYGPDPEPETIGHATPPDEFDTPSFTTGHAKPNQVPPNVTYNSYNWTTYTPPSVDNSGIIEVIESEINVINYLMGWLKDNIHGEFNNLIDNIKNFANYIGATMQYYLGLILDAIINGVNTFYNNIVSLIEPFIEHFTEPINTEEVNNAVEDTQIYALLEVGNGYYNFFTDFFDDIEEVHTLRFTIPYTILTKTDYIIIDFSWYDDIRDDVVPWIVGFLYAGFGLFIFRSIPSIIHGLSGVLQKGG